jgi:hypothetical protein
MVGNQQFHKLPREIGSANAMLESRVRGPWEDILQAAKLLDPPQPLEVHCINEIPDDLVEIDEAMDVVVNFPFEITYIQLALASAHLLVGQVGEEVLSPFLRHFQYIN